MKIFLKYFKFIKSIKIFLKTRLTLKSTYPYTCHSLCFLTTACVLPASHDQFVSTAYVNKYLKCWRMQRKPESSFSDAAKHLKKWKNSLVGHHLWMLLNLLYHQGLIIHTTKGKLLILLLIKSDHLSYLKCYMG